ncbi:MAG: hypothetical protein HPY66_1183 [Firmicutes bacterium]|nr:hypothetical protein [Bacillota bacterium]
MGASLPLQGVNHGVENLEVKEAGSRNAPASAHISPQRGLKDVSRRGWFLPFGVDSGVANRGQGREYRI